ncbi:MAG TPA: hypothetical protein PK887_09595 [Ignavibacteriales bacterium]|nr:hypothetical protein [Ignavibacteriales bacterium]
MKKLIFLFIICINIIVIPQSFKIKSLNFLTDYNFSFSTKNKELSIKSVKGFGGGIEISYNIYDNIGMSISYGYQLLDIDQDKRPLFKEWSWKAWKRYYGDINAYSTDSLFLKLAPQPVVKLIRDNPAYKNMDIFQSFIPEQKIDIYPLQLNFNYDYKIDNLNIKPAIGGGIIFFTRRLYVVEKWDKLFPELNYEYTYAFNNFCDKTFQGNVFNLNTSLELGYNIDNTIIIGLNTRYLYIFNTGKNNGYDHFPMKDLFSAQLKLSFIY